MKIEQSLQRQRGVTLIEILGALAIMAAMTAGVVRLIDQYTGDVKSSITAQHLSTISTAAQAYVKDNYGVIVGAATATVPAVVTVPMLIASGYLTAGYSTTNNYGQTACVLVLKPTANNLIALVSTEGGTAIDDITLGGVVSTLGASGGGVYSTATTTMRGAMGGWSSPATDFKANCASGVVTQSATTGHPVMALWFSNGDIASGFVHRDAVPGHPELNTMNTPLVMNSTQTSGAACTTTGAIARDASGAVMSCQGGTWKGGSGGLNWKGAVANVAALPASGNASGDAYRITNLSNHIFVWDSTSSVWQGLVVNSAGNLTLPGLIYTSGSSTTWGAITMQGSTNGWSGIQFKDSAGANAGTLMMRYDYSGFYKADDSGWRWYVDNAGNSIQPGNAEAGTLQVDTAVTEGSACSPDGKIAKSNVTSGLILSCQSGVWKAQEPYHFGGSYITNANTSCVVANPATSACSCPTGHSGNIISNYGWITGLQIWSVICQK